tara:strand:- start:590 stop:1558 length:969 start_codon:yes stop_codon:yes gene_type:complete
MKLKYATQLGLSELLEQNYDVIIVASGYESRSCKLAQRLKSIEARKIAISFQEQNRHSQRLKNDDFFKSEGYESFIAKEGSYEEIIQILNQVFTPLLGQNNLNILVDYSCMTKVWYSTIINYFQNRLSEIKKLKIAFSYSPSTYSAPKIPMPNKYMGPIPGIFRVTASNKPTALIIGLGYELERARGIVEYLDPEVTYIYYSKPAFDTQFVEQVEKNNKVLIESLPKENVIPYPVSDLHATDALLTSLCLKLGTDYRIVLAPLGPKPFALLCLLLSARYRDIDVWRVSAGDSGNIYDRMPSDDEPVVCQAFFESVKTEELVV